MLWCFGAQPRGRARVGEAQRSLLRSHISSSASTTHFHLDTTPYHHLTPTTSLGHAVTCNWPSASRPRPVALQKDRPAISSALLARCPTSRTPRLTEFELTHLFPDFVISASFTATAIDFTSPGDFNTFSHRPYRLLVRDAANDGLCSTVSIATSAHCGFSSNSSRVTAGQHTYCVFT